VIVIVCSLSHELVCNISGDSDARNFATVSEEQISSF